ncbi:MAG: PIN domain-containing protein [Fimbriimonadaceae bacterium]|nr:PIN domain-containing protein [Fimbriimonadaceae bacterium]
MVFVDTNVLVYATLANAPRHRAAVSALEAHLGQPRWISRQVLREYLAVLTRPASDGSAVPLATVLEQVELLQRAFVVADEDARVGTELCRLVATVPVAGKQVHDTIIVATMLVHGIGLLLTNNVEDFRRYAHWIEIVPLDRWAS